MTPLSCLYQVFFFLNGATRFPAVLQVVLLPDPLIILNSFFLIRSNSSMFLVKTWYKELNLAEYSKGNLTSKKYRAILIPYHSITEI